MKFSKTKQDQICDETARDSTLYGLARLIHEGWPDTLQEVPRDLREYWSIRDELALENGIIFKGQQILIPEPLQQDILKQLHVAHQGITKTRLLAREHVFWPRVNRDTVYSGLSATLGTGRFVADNSNGG